jgi:hypothetical protein
MPGTISEVPHWFAMQPSSTAFEKMAQPKSTSVPLPLPINEQVATLIPALRADLYARP